MKKIVILSLLSTVLLAGCYDMDIPPKNLITDDDILTNDAGMEIYLARMYSKMPFEDFKYLAEWGVEYNSWLGSMGIEGTGEALNRDGICTTFTSERTPWWGNAYALIRDANYLIENLPTYKDNFVELTFNNYIGQAYFVRAYSYYNMAKRYGGVPLVTETIGYPVEEEALNLRRSTEEETWDQVLADFDMAISLLQDETDNSTGYAQLTGFVGKNAALAWKSEAMLYAGSVAKYNEEVQGRLTGLGSRTGVRVIGFDAGTAKAASIRYFTEAYKAGREIMANPKYSLYKKKWAANDPVAQYENMVDMFSDLTNNPENIYVREYVYPTLTHGIDAYSGPFIWRNPLSCGTCPTLDFIELFDGFDRYPDGTIKVTTGNSNTDGNYLLYDTPMDFFANAEPRLRAYVLFPGDVMKNTEIEIRMGVYTGNAPISPLFSSYSYSNYSDKYEDLSAPIKLAATAETNPTVTYNNGASTITAAGANGPFYNSAESAFTGLLLRKWLNNDPSFVPGEGMSDQPFILMRYADVLLNVAEAAIELALEGQAAPDGGNLLQLATDNINEIRERAGAELITGTLSASETGRNVVRRERRKELALEHKTKWDLRRWRVQHYENREGFWGEERDKTAYSSQATYRFRGLYPFFSTEEEKYFFDAHFENVSFKSFSYNTVDYYFAIPGGEIAKSAVLDQQPNR